MTSSIAVTSDAQMKALAVAGKLAHNAEPGKSVPVTGGPYVMECKLDGWRILAHVHESGVTLYARSGNTYTDRLPHIVAELGASFPAGTWLDCEAVAIRVENGQMVDDWGNVQSVLTTLGPNSAAAKKVSLMVFDLLAHGGLDARPLPFVSRRELLAQVFDGATFKHLRLVPQLEASDAAHDAYVAMGFEGSMVKALNAPYASGKRGAGQIKLKPQTTIDTVVMGFKPGENGFSGMVGAVIFGQHVDGVLKERGRCSGMSMKVRVDMTKNPSKYVGNVMEIKHMGFMKDGLRHPQFHRMRADRDPLSVTYHNE